jgi:SAM-dependent methyltransferase
MPASWPPSAALVPDVTSALPFLNRVVELERAGQVNVQGGDVGGFGSPTLVVRHIANYQAAVEAVTALGAPDGPVLDVGCGVGALSAWAADRLGRDLILCDLDPAVLGVGANAFDVAATTDLAAIDPAPVVLAMEVLEHVEPDDQPRFMDQVWSRVAPGGLLVLSTPDESSYPGGWSGYRPHVGCVTPRQLTALLLATTGQDPTVVRLEGGPFRIPRGRRALERVANGAWGRLQSNLPGVAARLAERGGRQGPLRLAPLERAIQPVDILPAAHGKDTGLLAVVRRP